MHAAGGDQVECATVWSLAVTPDRSTLVAGGDFGLINGSYRPGARRLRGDGGLTTAFRPVSNGRVTRWPRPTTLLAGGSFSGVSGQPREGLASADLASGSVLPFTSVVTRSTQAVVRGARAIALRGWRSVDRRWRVRHAERHRDSWTGRGRRGDRRDRSLGCNRIFSRAFVTSVNVYGDTVYSTADALGTTSEGIIAYDAETGAEVWYDSCRGASHSMAVVRGVVYVGSHSHDCGVMVDGFPEQYQGYESGVRRRYTLRAEVPAGEGNARLLQWFPRTNDGNGARSMATDARQPVDWRRVHFRRQRRSAGHDQIHVPRQRWTGPQASDSTTGDRVLDTAWGCGHNVASDRGPGPSRPGLRRDQGRGTRAIRSTRSIPVASPGFRDGIPFRTVTFLLGEVHRYDIRAIDDLGVQSNRSSSTYVTVASDIHVPGGYRGSGRRAGSVLV